jgi:hypothetical protein
MSERIQRRRTKGWRMPPGAVYVGRPTKWGNPWRVGSGRFIGEISENWFDVPVSPLGAVRQYEAWLRGSWPLVLPSGLTINGWRGARRYLAARREAICNNLLELRGRDLVCWCPLDAPCHADVLLEMANAPLAPLPRRRLKGAR